jgi:hypothetical protein
LAERGGATRHPSLSFLGLKKRSAVSRRALLSLRNTPLTSHPASPVFPLVLKYTHLHLYVNNRFVFLDTLYPLDFSQTHFIPKPTIENAVGYRHTPEINNDVWRLPTRLVQVFSNRRLGFPFGTFDFVESSKY